ncbi:MAG: hypothetical protein IPO07_17780 [Haliscomenobacter sp.]|nr:hypothetical protein [Haliscomenobacter sp.]MBK9490420.1 hypothetical protein [Haliscomenobacter sp.]
MIHSNRDQIRRIVSIQVYNRWGLLIHQDQDYLPNEGPRRLGRYERLDLPGHIYVCVTVELADGRLQMAKGGYVVDAVNYPHPQTPKLPSTPPRFPIWPAHAIVKASGAQVIGSRAMQWRQAG